MSRRGKLLTVVIAAAVIGLVVLTVAAINSATAGCGYPPPEPNLPPALLATGGFVNPVGANPQVLDQMATEAVTALYPGVTGTPQTAVEVAAASSNQASALVVPLTASTSGATKVVAVVAFLRDCSGRLFYDTARSFAAQPLKQFPAVDGVHAEQQLGAASVQLIWTSDPTLPLWRDPQSGRTLAAT